MDTVVTVVLVAFVNIVWLLAWWRTIKSPLAVLAMNNYKRCAGCLRMTSPDDAVISNGQHLCMACAASKDFLELLVGEVGPERAQQMLDQRAILHGMLDGVGYGPRKG